MDAVTRLEARGLKRVLDTFLASGGVLSVNAYHRVRRSFEHLSAFFNLTMTMGVGAFTVLGDRVAPAGLFGPFLLLARDTYFRGGGHAAVKGEVLENMFMARRFRDLGIRMRCRGGRGAVSVRMYPEGLRELREGWGKAFITGAGRTHPVLLVLSAGWITGATVAVILTVAATFSASPYAQTWTAPGLYALFALQLALMLRRIGSFKAWTWIVFPVPLFFYLFVFTQAAARRAMGRETSWKGRSIDAGGSPAGGADTC